MATITLDLSFEIYYVAALDNLVLTGKVKTQKHPFADSVMTCGVSGDIAGTIISKLNSDFVGVENGKVKTTIRNILSINETPPQPQMNDIVRSGSDFYFSGNNMFKVSSNQKDQNLIYKLLTIYINTKLSSYLEPKIFSINSFETELRSYLEEINRKLKKYMSSYTLTYEWNRKERTVYIYLMEDYTKMIRKFVFVIDMK